MRTWLCLQYLILYLSVSGLVKADAPQSPDSKPPSTTSESPAKTTAIDAFLGQEDPQRYMRLHHRISWHFRSWAEYANKIGDTGDAFTLFLLKRKVLDELRPDELQLRKQIIDRIERQRGKNPDQIRVDEVGYLIRNATYQDEYVCNPTQFVMIKWLQSQLRNQLSDPRMRKRIEELRSELQQSSKAEAELEECPLLPTNQLRRFLDTLLEVDPKPATRKN